jgi:hypothetical protein
VTTINAAASFAVPGGPTLVVNSVITAEAYDRIDIEVNPGDTDKRVEIQPGAAAQIRLLVIKSSLYGSQITYHARDGTTDSDDVTLDGPQVFIGAGAIALFAVAPKMLEFSNTNSDPAKKAQIEILVGRDATP